MNQSTRLPSLTRRRLAGATIALGLALHGLPGYAANPVDTLVVAQPTDVISMNPITDSSLQSLNVFRNIFDQLAQIDAEGNVIPWLSTDWHASEDLKSWTFSIRKTAKFHNGKPVTAADVVWSYEAVFNDTKSANRVYLTRMTKVQALDDYTVQFTLSEPYVLWPRQTSLIHILPKDNEVKPDGQPTVMGSGAYKFLRWVKDDRVEMEANPDWWGGAPKIKNVTFRPVPSEAARANGLISGELNVVPLLPPSQLPMLETRKDVKIVKFQSNRNIYLGINTTLPVLNDQKFREAMDHAIDRDAITAKLIRGYGTPMGTQIAPKVFGYDGSLAPSKYDPAMAKKALAESSYKGEEIPFVYTIAQVAYGDQVVQAIANYLQTVGIKTKITPLDAAATTALAINRKHPGIYLQIFAPSIMDADLSIGNTFERNTRGYWINDEVLELSKAQRAEAVPAKRLALLSKVWQIARAETAFVFLYNEGWAFGMSPNVKWMPAPDGGLVFHYAEIGK